MPLFIAVTKYLGKTVVSTHNLLTVLPAVTQVSVVSRNKEICRVKIAAGGTVPTRRNWGPRLTSRARGSLPFLRSVEVTAACGPGFPR